MQIIKSVQSKKSFVTVVCCQHGNEQLGLKIIEALKPYIDTLPGLMLIIANEEAIAIDKRFVDQDLNRSYPGSVKGNLEVRLANRILREVKGSRYVLDVHTSVSKCGALVPIFAKRSASVKRIVNLLEAKNIVQVKEPLAATSLIGNVDGGVSLEFEKALFTDASVDLVVQLVKDLYANVRRPKKARALFEIIGVIDKNISLPLRAKNFMKVPGHNFYPVLLKESSYIGNQGLRADKKIRVLI